MIVENNCKIFARLTLKSESVRNYTHGNAYKHMHTKNLNDRQILDLNLPSRNMRTV